MPDPDYYSFDEVLNDLKLEEDELKRLVSAGEIRAFRDKNTMRFKAEDVARLRGQRTDPQDVELDDLELELEDAVEAPAPVGGELGSEFTAETIDLGEIPAGEELVLEETSDTGEVIDIGGEAEVPVVIESTPTRAARATGDKRKAAKVAAPADPVEEITEGGAVLALMLVGVVVLIVANFLVFDAAVGRASSAITRAVANLFS